MPSTEAEVEAALLALNDDPEIPFTVARDGEKIVATWVYDDARNGGNSSRQTYRLKVTPLPETHEYKASSMTVSTTTTAPGSFSDKYAFSSGRVTKPVFGILAEHGWTKKKGLLGRLFS